MLKKLLIGASLFISVLIVMKGYNVIELNNKRIINIENMKSSISNADALIASHKNISYDSYEINRLKDENIQILYTLCNLHDFYSKNAPIYKYRNNKVDITPQLNETDFVLSLIQRRDEIVPIISKYDENRNYLKKAISEFNKQVDLYNLEKSKIYSDASLIEIKIASVIPAILLVIFFLFGFNIQTTVNVKEIGNNMSNQKVANFNRAF